MRESNGSTDERCQRLFDKYNVRFFGGRLPKYRVLRSDRFIAGEHGLCRKKQREIHLGTALKGARLREVLLHEMAHAAVGGSHGKKWLAEMLRLAKMGAPTRNDWEVYRNPKRTWAIAAIKCECYDYGFETDALWSKVRARVGYEYGLTDVNGQVESTSATKLLRRLREEFTKGRRERKKFLEAQSVFRPSLPKKVRPATLVTT